MNHPDLDLPATRTRLAPCVRRPPVMAGTRFDRLSGPGRSFGFVTSTRSPIMKCALTLDLLLGPERNLLARLATTLGELRIVPESFVWTALPGTNEARLWLVLDTELPRLELLAEDFRQNPRIRQVRRGFCDSEESDLALSRFFPLGGGI